MNIRAVPRTIVFGLLVVSVLGISASAQETRNVRDEQANFNLELYVMIAGNDSAKEGKTSATLEPALKQLRQTLPFKYYNLETTLLNRVKNGGGLSLNWIVGPLSRTLTSPTTTPTFNEFSITQLKLVSDGDRQTIQLLRFSFGTRVPVQTGTNMSASGTNAVPVFAYERVGLVTDLSVREGEPAIVGTLNVGSSGEALVLIVLARRVNN